MSATTKQWAGRVISTRDAKGETLLSVAVRAAGPTRGRRVLTFLTQWQIARNARNGEAITLEAFAEHWLVPRANAYRWRTEYRSVFPKVPDPNDLLDLVAEAAEWNAAQGVNGLAETTLPSLS